MAWVSLVPAIPGLASGAQRCLWSSHRDQLVSEPSEIWGGHRF